MPGLTALLALAGVAPEAVDLETVAFTIAPRLNAAGRVGDATEAARLLLTDDPAEAALLAERLQAANLVRREMTRTAMVEAQAALAAEPGDPAATVVRGDWPVGVIGLVAGRLAEERGRPAVVGTELDGVVRASCRSAGGFDLAAALAACTDLFIRHGGHPGAAGFELASDRWEAFRERFLALVTAAVPPASDPRPELRVDLVVPGSAVDYAFLAELRRLDPTGPGNPDPLIAVEDLTVTRVRAANGGHAQLTLRKRVEVIDGIAFGRADLVEVVREGDRLDVLARLVTRRFGGYESLQLEIRDVAPAGYAATADGAGGPGPGRGRGHRAGPVRTGRHPMTDAPPRRRRSGRPSDPFGIGPRGNLLAPVLAALGLGLVAIVTLALFTGSIPLAGGGSGSGGTGDGGGGGGPVGPIVTPVPSNIVLVDPRTNIPGTLVFVKQGNLWTQTGNKAVQLTTSGLGAMPSWSPDGKWIYYIESVQDRGYFPGGGNAPSTYDMEVPVLTRIRPDGTGAEKLLSGALPQGSVRLVLLDPPARGLARTAGRSRSPRTARIRRRATSSSRPTTSRPTRPAGSPWPRTRRSATRTRPGDPDGKQLLYVKNGRDGARGAPVIYRYDPATKKTSPLSPPGYMQPSWSPDGRWIAVTKTSTFGTDVAILDARNGTEVLRLTTDDRSWAPVWSPKGDSIAYMHIEGLIVDLKLIGLKGDGPVVDDRADARHHRAERARRRLGRQLVHPGRPAPPADPWSELVGRPARRRPALRDGRLPRTARRAQRRRRDASCAWGSIPTRPVCHPGSGPTSAASRRSAGSSSRRPLPSRPRSSRTSPSSRRSDRRGSPPSSGSGRLCPRTCRSSPTSSAAISGRRPPARRPPCSTVSERMPSRSIPTSGRRRSGRSSTGPIGSPTSSAGPPTPAPVSSRTSSSRPTRRPDAPAERLFERVARRAIGWGPGGTVGLVVGATAPAEMARIRAVAPGLAFLVPGVGAQGGEVEPVLEHGPATAGPAAAGIGRGLLVNVSQGDLRGDDGELTARTKTPARPSRRAAADWARRLPVLP